MRKVMFNSIPFINAGAHVGLDMMTGKVFVFSSSLFRPVRISSSRPSTLLELTLLPVEKVLRGEARSESAHLAYLARSDGLASLVHLVEVINLKEGRWFEAYIDAHSGELLSVTNFVSRASYYAIPISKASIAAGQEMIVDPEDYEASPLGWHNDGNANITVTSGNNVLSFKWLDPGYAYSNGNLSNSADPSSLTFSMHYNTTLPSDNPTNLEAARTNAFYIMNVMHDVFYRYGFTEDAFNFQVTNLRGSGKTRAADPVRVSVQAEGAGPNRDGAIANDILVHEVTHGLTQRMTGGGTSRCLQTLEAEGLGEGWSDIMAEWVQLTGGDMRDYAFATYVAGNDKGLRTYPYSTSISTNPRRYSDVAIMNEPHDIGEVWGNILHNILAVLIDKYGWSSAAMTDPQDLKEILCICICSSMPYHYNHVTPLARDAFIQADAIRYNGVNKCLLWRVFARHGLGVNAADYVDDPTIPDDC
ncbi:unnamed protein product [Cyclocybe aegerita]|uniref:Extracellular metalloproteinase n=1 Tax=Cyclocybe aegerita TaxID=1973307 RepID=A0A8S0WU24_CYCAE|nr:unnamed protein product [Cyclocybe aegerita]